MIEFSKRERVVASYNRLGQAIDKLFVCNVIHEYLLSMTMIYGQDNQNVVKSSLFHWFFVGSEAGLSKIWLI